MLGAAPLGESERAPVWGNIVRDHFAGGCLFRGTASARCKYRFLSEATAPVGGGFPARFADASRGRCVDTYNDPGSGGRDSSGDPCIRSVSGLPAVVGRSAVCPGCGFLPKPLRVIVGVGHFCDGCAEALSGLQIGERNAEDGSVSLRRSGAREIRNLYWVGPNGRSLHRGTITGTTALASGNRAYLVGRPERVQIIRGRLSVAVR